MKKKLPVGIDNFEKLRTQEFYYVDKTGLIAEIMSNWCEVNLFTRPRRFGKTLCMSMLKSFFEIGTDKSIFDGLAISSDTALCERYMGRYPVVFLSLKDVDGLTFETAYQALCRVIWSEAVRVSFLKNSDKIDASERAAFEALLNRNDTDSDLRGSLKRLCFVLAKDGEFPRMMGLAGDGAISWWCAKTGG